MAGQLGEQLDEQSLNQLVSKNAAFSLFANVLYLVTRVFIPPLTLTFVSLEEYGIWAFCFILIGYFGMGAFGISNAYIRYVGLYFTRGDIKGISRLLSTGLAITVIGGVFLLFGLALAMPLIIRAFNIPQDQYQKAFVLLYGTSVIFVFDLSVGAFAYVLTGMQRIVQERSVWMVSFLLESILIVALLFSGLGVYALLWAFGFRYLFSVSAYLVLCYKHLPGLKLGWANVDKSYLKYFVKFGGMVQLTGMLAIVGGSLAKVFSGLFLTIETVGLFDLGQKFPMMGASVPQTVSGAIFPAVTHLDDSGRRGEIAVLYLRSIRYIHLITGFLMGFLFWFAFAIMGAWVGTNPKYELAVTLMMLFCLPYQIHTLTGPAGSVFKGIGKPGRESLYPLVLLLVTFVLLGVSFWLFGKTAVSIGAAVGLGMVIAALLYLFYANRFLEIGWRDFLLQVFLPGMVPYVIGGLLYWASRPLFTSILDQRWWLLLACGLAGVVYVSITGAVTWRFFFDDDERRVIHHQLQSRLGKWLPGSRK